jgi:hypothetical protein
MPKTTLALLGLLLSIAGQLCAQENDQPQGKQRLSVEDKVFEAPPYAMSFQYRIELGKGNILAIDLANGYDIYNFRNIDSLLAVFLTDMEAFRDSLTDPLTIKNIDYLIDTSSRKKVRIRQYRPAATSFLLDGAGPSILRIQQDTIRILIVTRPTGQSAGLTVKGLRYNRLSFFVNHYDELNSLIRSNLNEDIAGILSHGKFNHDMFYHPQWKIIINDSIVQTIPSRGNGDQLEVSAGVAAGTYKNFFAPSFRVGAYVNLNRGLYRYHIGLSWEPLFFFAPNAQDHLQTFRNDLLVASYEQTRSVKDNPDPSKPRIGLQPNFSFGYVIHREGDYFTQPSFRVTLGAAGLGNAVKIQPVIYFNNFFKGVTPGLRLSLGFL